MKLREKVSAITESCEFMHLNQANIKPWSIEEMFRLFSDFKLPVKLAVDAFRKNCSTGEVLSYEYMDCDFQVPLLFFFQTCGIPLESRFHATIYFIIELLCYENMEEIQSMEIKEIHSRHAVDNEGKPIDLRYLQRDIEIIIRKAAISAALIKTDSFFRDLHKDYVELLMLSANDPFDHCGPQGMDDPSILIKEMVQYSLVAGPLFEAIHFEPVTTELHYREASEFLTNIRKEAAKLKINYEDPWETRSSIMKMHSMAGRVVRFMDEWGMGMSQEADPVLETDRNKPRIAAHINLSLNDIAGACNLESVASSFIKSRTINGSPVLVEYMPALEHRDDYQYLSSQVAPHVSRLASDIMQIYTNREVEFIEECEVSGEISPVDYYRAEADLKIFNDISTRLAPENTFYTMVTVDNSGSFYGDKQLIMAKILTLMANTMMKHPDKFIHLAAYAQHSSSNNIVTLRRLVDDEVRNIIDPSPVLHLTNSGMNYDAFAAHEVVTRHADGFGNARPLLIMCGDAEPVSYTGQNSTQETIDVFAELRRKHPGLIIMCLAVDVYNPPEKLYDYFVSLASSQPIEDFMIEFSKMINKIVLKEEVFNAPN